MNKTYTHEKLLIPIIGCLLFNAVLSGQANKKDFEILQNQYLEVKKEKLAKIIDLEEADSDAFWKLYRQYEKDEEKNGENRI